MEKKAKATNASNGLMFGLIAGLVYCISLFTRYNYAINNPIMLGIITFLFYLVVIGTLVFCGLNMKKQLGGYLEMKDASQTIFIAVLVAEFIYVLFNFVYLKYIDPEFFEKFKASMQSFIENSSMNDNQKTKQLERIEEQLGKQEGRLTIKGMFLSYLISVAITGVIGLIVSLIIKKKKPVFDQLDMR